MGIVIAYSKKEKAKVKVVGKTLNLLTLLVVISKLVAEKVSKEKKMSTQEAENFVVECIKNGLITIKD